MSALFGSNLFMINSQAEENVRTSKREYNAVSRTLSHELERTDLEQVLDLSHAISGMVASLAQGQQEVVEIWESYNPQNGEEADAEDEEAAAGVHTQASNPLEEHTSTWI